MSALLLLASAALSAPTSELLPSLAAEAEASSVLACAPFGDVVALLGRAPGLPEALDDPRRADLLRQLAAPGGVEAAGFDPRGALTVVVPSADAPAVVRVPFSGDADQAAAVMVQLHGPGALEGPGVAPAEGPWVFEGARSGRPVTATLAEGALRFTTPPAEGSRRSPLDPALLEGLPEVPGCALALNLDEQRRPGRLGQLPELDAMALFLPTAGEGPMLLRLSDPSGATALEPSGAPPALGTGMELPLVVISVDLSPAALMARDDLPDALVKMGVSPTALEASPVALQPGFGVALFGDPAQVVGAGPDAPRDLTWAAVLPATMDSGAPLRPGLTAWRVRRALRGSGVDASRDGWAGLVVDGEGGPAHVRVLPDRLVLSDDPALVEVAASGEGVPWADEAHLSRARGWTVAVSAPNLSQAVGAPAELFIGLRARGELVELQAELISPARTPIVTSALSTMLELTRGGQPLDARLDQLSGELEGARPPEQTPAQR